MNLKEFQEEIAKLNQWAQHGCSDGGCQIEKPSGLCTNGGCRCSPRFFVDQLLSLSDLLDEMGRYARWPEEK